MSQMEQSLGFDMPYLWIIYFLTNYFISLHFNYLTCRMGILNILSFIYSLP